MTALGQHNQLLTTWPTVDRRHLVRQAEVVTLHNTRELYPDSGPIAEVYFPLTFQDA